MKTFPLTPLTRKPKQIEFIALAVDGDGSANGFKYAAAYDETGLYPLPTKADVRKFLFQRGHTGKIILTYDLEFTYATLFQPFKAGWNILMNNGNWLKASYDDGHKHHYVAWDIKRIAPLPFTDLARCVGLSDNGFGFGGGSRTDISIAQRPGSDTDFKDPSAHPCYRAAGIIWKFARLYQTTLNALGGQMKMTAASTAMDLFRRAFLTDEIPPTDPDRNLIARACYYGGRVENYRVGTDRDINVYDVNSLYPAVMRDLEVGLPSSYHRLYKPHILSTYLDYPGQWFGTIQLPAAFIGPLPLKANHRLYYPYGTMRGSWTFSEVRNALENGARVLDTEWVIYASQGIKPFGPYVDALYARKMASTATLDPAREVYKLLLNSLYGKFGQHSDTGLQSLEVPTGDFELEDYADCQPVSIAGYLCFLRERPTHIQSPHVQVMWAAEIAAQARVKLYDYLQPLDMEVNYCDTDSIHTSERLSTNDSLGSLKLERTFARVSYYAPKEYGGITSRGEFIAHAKGIPEAQQAEYLRCGHAAFTRPLHTLEVMRTNERIGAPKATTKFRRTNPTNRKHKRIRDYNLPAIYSYPAHYPEEILTPDT